MSIWGELKTIDKKGLFQSNNNTVSYPTGILALDYANGYWTKVRETPSSDLVDKPVIGIPSGSLVSLISETGGGKTTFAIQIGWNIVKPFKNGMMCIVDCEKTTNIQRVMNLTHTSYEDPRIRLLKDATTIEDVLQMVDDICQVKEVGGKEFMYEVQGMSYDGKPFSIYEPTIFIIDSLPSFNSKEYNTKDLGNQIDQMKASKDITRFYTNVLDKCYKYNIIFIVINHIRSATVTNPYQTPPRGLLMINPMTETLPRGSVPQYFSNTYFRIRTKKSQAYTEKDYGFTGYKCEIQIAKSKTNNVGTSFPVTFNTAKGFDPIYSIYEFADSLGLVIGRNPKLKLHGFTEDDPAFDRKQWNNLMMLDKNFRKRVLEVLRPYYIALLGDKVVVDEENNVIDIRDINGEKIENLEYGSISLDEVS